MCAPSELQPGHCAVVHCSNPQTQRQSDEAIQFMEQPANSSCFWLELCLVVRYSIDFLSSVPLPVLCRYAPVLRSHSLRKEREGAADGVYVKIVTPIVHMEKVWNVRRLGVRGELSLRGSDRKMNPGFHFCVIQTFVIIYLGI